MTHKFLVTAFFLPMVSNDITTGTIFPESNQHEQKKPGKDVQKKNKQRFPIDLRQAHKVLKESDRCIKNFVEKCSVEDLDGSLMLLESRRRQQEEEGGDDATLSGSKQKEAHEKYPGYEKLSRYGKGQRGPRMKVGVDDEVGDGNEMVLPQREGDPLGNRIVTPSCKAAAMESCLGKDVELSAESVSKAKGHVVKALHNEVSKRKQVCRTHKKKDCKSRFPEPPLVKRQDLVTVTDVRVKGGKRKATKWIKWFEDVEECEKKVSDDCLQGINGPDEM